MIFRVPWFEKKKKLKICSLSYWTEPKRVVTTWCKNIFRLLHEIRQIHYRRFDCTRFTVLKTSSPLPLHLFFVFFGDSVCLRRPGEGGNRRPAKGFSPAPVPGTCLTVFVVPAPRVRFRPTAVSAGRARKIISVAAPGRAPGDASADNL